MAIDYEVFKSDNERLSRFIVRFLRENEHNASYQIGYPENKIFVRVETKEEANQISDTIRSFVKELRLTDSELEIELNKPIRIPIRWLRLKEKAANLSSKLERESEEPELEETEPERIAPEAEEPEPELIFEPETKTELEPEELEEPKEPEPEPELKEPESEPILELEMEIEPEEYKDSEPEDEEPEPKQMKKKTVEELFGSKKTF